MNGTQSVEVLIHRYIRHHELGKGAQLPSQADLAAACRCDEQALVAGLESALGRGVITRGPQGSWVVQSPLVMRDQESLSLSNSAREHDEILERSLREVALREPIDDPDDPFTVDLERRAHAVLGLGEGEPFIVINRLHFFQRDGKDLDPRVIHRLFLDPKRFASTFLDDHDFSKESMIDIYNRNGYIIAERPNAIRSRAASTPERIDLRMELGAPVLDLEQRTNAYQLDDSTPILLEYLRATYWNITFDFLR